MLALAVLCSHFPQGSTPLPVVQAVLALTVLVDGRLVSGAGDGTMHVWARLDASSVAPSSPPPGGGGALRREATCRVNCVVRGLAPLAAGGFASVGNDGVLRAWSATATELTAAPPVGCYLFCVVNCTPTGIETSGDGGNGASIVPQQLATGSDDGVVRVWALSGPAGAQGGLALRCVQQLRTPGGARACAHG